MPDARVILGEFCFGRASIVMWLREKERRANSAK